MAEAAAPYGGQLVQLEPSGVARRALLARAARLPAVPVADVTLAHLEAIAVGAYSPLKGFMNSADCRAVVERMELADGTPWPLPVLLPLPEEWARRPRAGSEVALTDAGGHIAGIVRVEDVFRPDPGWKTHFPFGADLPLGLRAGGTVFAGGEVRLLQRRPPRCPRHQEDPSEVRAAIAGRGWRTVAGCVTRDVIHRDGEYMLKTALEGVDGLLLQAVVADADEPLDFPARIRVRCHEVTVREYFPTDRVHLMVQAVSEPLGSPRHALLAAIVLRNYGCTHAIISPEVVGASVPPAEGEEVEVGRLEAAQTLYERFRADLGVEVSFFSQPLYCDACGSMVTDKTCPHGVLERVMMDRERLRRLLLAGVRPPVAYTRPEVANILCEWAKGSR